MKLSVKAKRLLVGGVGGFMGGGLGTVAGSNDTWINMIVGAFGALMVVFLINGFLRD